MKPNIWARHEVHVDPTDVANLKMKILAVRGMRVGSKEVEIDTDRGTIWMYHPQECCEQVELVDVTGDPEDLVGGILVLFEHRTHRNPNEKPPKKSTKKGCPANDNPFVFYELRTTKGDVTLRWEKTSDTAYGTDVIVRFKEAE